jgi:acetyl/propionyl-CoA carboxylase alpha subunit
VLDGGEGGRRVLRAIHELARIGESVTSVAIHERRDRLARNVRDSDEAPEFSGSLETALRAARADSAWLVPAPLAERAAFADACTRASFIWSHPPRRSGGWQRPMP